MRTVVGRGKIPRPPMDQPSFQPGDVIADKYVMVRLLGQGGMGFVVAAEHRDLAALVALKFLLPEVAADPKRQARFIHEARAAIHLKSEHVAHVLDLGKLENGTPFIVMEYLEGSTVADLLNEQGPLSVEVAVGLLMQVCDAVTEAHALGVIHRDLKPSNLFLCRKGDGTTTLKVMDFGISKVTGVIEERAVEQEGITRTGAMVGSPAYMPPEQIRDAKNVDARADIWSLGVLLFELLTCRHPFENHSVGGLLAAIVASPPLPLSTVWREVPVGLEAVVNRALSKQPEDRFPSAAAFADAIRPYASCKLRLQHNDRVSQPTADTSCAIDSSLAGSMEPHSIAVESTLNSAQFVNPGQDAPCHEQPQSASGSHRLRILGAVGVAVLALVALLIVSSSNRVVASRNAEAPAASPTLVLPPPPTSESMPVPAEPPPSVSIAPKTRKRAAPPATSSTRQPESALPELDGLIDDRH